MSYVKNKSKGIEGTGGKALKKKAKVVKQHLNLETTDSSGFQSILVVSSVITALILLFFYVCLFV